MTADGLAKFTSQLAKSMQVPVHLISVLPPQKSDDEVNEPDQWPALERARIALLAAGVATEWVVCRASNVGQAIRQIAHAIKASTVVLGWHGKARADGTVANAVLENLLQNPSADVVVVGGGAMHNCQRILVPYTDGAHSELALRLGMILIEGQQQGDGTKTERKMTALHVISPSNHKADRQARDTLLRVTKPYGDKPKWLHMLEVVNKSAAKAILEEVQQGYDLIVIGTSSENMFDQVLFGTLPRQVAAGCELPIVVTRRHTNPVPRVLKTGWRALFTAMPKLDSKERAELKVSMRKSAAIHADFVTMMTLSTVIAAFGLLLNSPAVIIGAMLVAPLMAAIIGVALASVYGDTALLATSARTALVGVLLSISISWLIGLLVPNAATTSEILSRTHPNLLDLVVALAAGAAGAYALCRKEVASSLAGVAIAVALVPPLASVGILLSLGEFSLAAGAALLFITNLIAIAAAGTLVFLLLGFAPPEIHKKRRRIFQRGLQGATAMLIAIALVLGFLTIQGIRDARFKQTVRQALATRMDEQLHVDLIDADFSTDVNGALLVVATVRAQDIIPREDIAVLQADLARRFERPVGLELIVLPVIKLPPPEPTPSPLESG